MYGGCLIELLRVILFSFFRWEEEQLPEGVKWLHMEHKVILLLLLLTNRHSISFVKTLSCSNYILLIYSHSWSHTVTSDCINFVTFSTCQSTHPYPNALRWDLKGICSRFFLLHSILQNCFDKARSCSIILHSLNSFNHTCIHFGDLFLGTIFSSCI